MKVFVTGAGALLGQGILRSLRSCSPVPEVVAVDPSPLSAGLYWADRAHLVPMASDPDYLPAIERLLERERPDAVLVGTDVELLVFAEHRAALEARYGTRVLVSSPEVVRIADDKYLTWKFLHEHGLPAPGSALAVGARELAREVGFPLVVKPRVGARSIGVGLVQSARELDERLDGDCEGLVFQELAGPSDLEYTAGTLTFDGVCRASILMRRDLRDGNTYRAFVEHDPEVDRQVRAMAEALGGYGPINFQFRLKDGVARVFEINGRFSGTTPLRARAGFNEVDMCLRYLMRGEAIEQPAIEDVVILRHWSETVVRREELLVPGGKG